MHICSPNLARYADSCAYICKTVIQKFKQMNVGNGFDEETAAGPVVSCLPSYVVVSLALRKASLSSLDSPSLMSDLDRRATYTRRRDYMFDNVPVLIVLSILRCQRCSMIKYSPTSKQESKPERSAFWEEKNVLGRATSSILLVS